jgi:hypothetical protein
MEYLAPPDFAVRGAEPERDSRLRRAVEAGWAVPPNPEAAQFGLGLFAPLSAATELAPSEEWIEPSFSDASAEQVYHQVSADCGASISPASSSSFDSALMDQLHADFITIEADTKTLGGFQYLQDRYYACLEDRGLTTQEPRDLLRILEDSGVAGDKAAQLEVDLAVGDSTCRLPLYDDFILLNADAWESWLNERAADIDAVVKQFDYFEGVALDVWNSSKSTTSD